MTPQHLFIALSLLSQFLVVGLVLRTGKKRAFALSLSFFLADSACMQLATLIHLYTGSPYWRVADLVLTALAPAFAVHAVAAFVDMSVRDARVVRLSYAGSCALALVTACAWWDRALLPSLESPIWTAAFLALWVLQAGYMGVRLHMHRRSSMHGDERVRTRLLISAFAAGAAGVSTEFLPEFGGPALRLGPHGLWLMSLLLGWLVLRHGATFRGHQRALTMAQMALVVIGALAVAGVSAFVPHREWVIAACATALAGVVALAVRESTQRVAAHDEGKRRVMLLGAYAEQMAHDLRNPLAAVLGAVDELCMDAKTMPEDSLALLQLIHAQAMRMNVMIEEYQHLGGTELRLRQVSLDDLCMHVARMTRLAVGPTRVVKCELGQALPSQKLDADQIGRALENVLRNAIEASSDGTQILLQTKTDRDGVVAIQITDSGVGMTSVAASRAFDEFYTTKADGRGIGLSYVRRVMRAHGGDATLQSALGKGTTVTLTLPLPRV